MEHISCRVRKNESEAREKEASAERSSVFIQTLSSPTEWEFKIHFGLVIL